MPKKGGRENATSAPRPLSASAAALAEKKGKDVIEKIQNNLECQEGGKMKLCFSKIFGGVFVT